ncbi:apses transcription factor-like protein [Dothidotthia symphoricarpi CBS 119687]|uniref:Transcription factor SWI6 n=1 Tax=Dothidotthia symphoricarpi CBS 119687 TaxID=1392245 RepID=A0A6A6A9L1_9PLEO|nr:apses transcription factor-like protein [Dothidotthia symphoricarpi CBS 119687]KAF2127527.1 apses transcription factor-like protein [Dothidotthia symphoricarpi CBS 119687]
MQVARTLLASSFPAAGSPSPSQSQAQPASQSQPQPQSQVQAQSQQQSQPQSQSQPQAHPHMYANSPQGLMAAPAFNRSFSDVNGFQQHAMEKPQIYTAVYSGVSVYEMEVNRVAVMRRRSDGWLNATQILKVAGVDKGKRTKVLEKEILTGEHEKVQGGYGKYQGTWIGYRRGREFCRQYGVEDILRPLLDYDISADGNAGQGIETPTKEQAMAANRKRFYTQSIDGRSTSQSVGGTFFSNISSTATSALAAMNKVARLNSPAPRPASSSQGRRSMARPQQAPVVSQDSFRTSSQQSVPSMASERSFTATNGHTDSAYATGLDETQEPPRKRMRASQEESFSQPVTMKTETSMRDHGSPTEPSDSFYQHQTGHRISLPDGTEVPSALPPLPRPDTKESEDKQAMLTDLFADQQRTDFTNHPAMLHLSGTDLDMPIDNTLNTALHWAATLARVSLMRLLVSKGANMFRGNATGMTPLMSAVSVNNSLDHSCFPETLEILAPLIELRDTQGRTILHHIAVTCAIKGRAASSKYYLEALLEYLVRSNIGANQPSSFHDNHPKPIGLMRFMQEMVNARDKAGSTALNLAARIGNRNIISQLMEVQADPTIPNHKGTRPIDFGVGSDIHGDGEVIIPSPSKGKAPLSKVEETSREIQPLMSGILQSASMQFTQEARLKQDTIDRTNDTIAQLSALQKTEQQNLESLRLRLRACQDRAKRIANLKRWLEPQRHMLSVNAGATDLHEKRRIGYADQEGAGLLIQDDDLPYDVRHASHLLLRRASDGPQYASTPLPADIALAVSHGSVAVHPRLSAVFPAVLRHRIEVYTKANAALLERSRRLKEKDGQLEVMYIKVVSLCTKVPEERVDECIHQLFAALDSDPLEGMEVGRVKEFLRKVEGVEG